MSKNEENYWYEICKIKSKLIWFQTSCTFNKYGSGGGKEIKNGICILSQNIINQKIYLALWFWYIFVLLIGVVQLVFEAVVIAVPAFRNLLITWNLVIWIVEFPREGYKIKWILAKHQRSAIGLFKLRALNLYLNHLVLSTFRQCKFTMPQRSAKPIASIHHTVGLEYPSRNP